MEVEIPGADIRRLKLLTGVETSTWLVRRSGILGYAEKTRSLRRVAVAKIATFLRSIGMMAVVATAQSSLGFH